MTPLTRLSAALLALATACACDSQRLSECQKVSSAVAATGSAIMHHHLDAPHFERVLERAQRDVTALDSIPELDPAKSDYRIKMAKALVSARKASASPSASDRIDANTSARAEAAKATYHVMESANLHCAGER